MVLVVHEQVFLVKQVVAQASWEAPVAPVLVSIHCYLFSSRQVLVLVVLLDFQRNSWTKIKRHNFKQHLKVFYLNGPHTRVSLTGLKKIPFI